MTDAEKLIMLADACSDLIYGGERGWESVPFEEFVGQCREAVAKGVQAQNTSRAQRIIAQSQGIVLS